MPDAFGYWPEGAAYVSPKEPKALIPLCPACGSRHAGRTVNCNLINELSEEPTHAEPD